MLVATLLCSLVGVAGADAQPELAGPGLELTQTTGFIHEPSVAFDPDGGFAVVWNRLEGCSGGGCTGSVIVGRRFSAAGEVLGDEFEIASDETVTNDAPKVSFSPQGIMAVLWTISNSTPNERPVLKLRLYDRHDALIGAATIRPRVSPEYLLGTALTSLPDGDFMVVWNSSWFFDLVEGQRFSSDGRRRGKRFIINTQGAGFEAPAIASNSAGEVFVVWARGDLFFAGEKTVQARRFGPNGKARGFDFSVNGEPRKLAYFHSKPSVALDDDDEAAVVWIEARHTVNQGIRFRRVDNQGQLIGREIQVDELPGWNAEHPVVVAVEDKQKLVVWQRIDDLEDDTAQDVFARLIDPDGQPSGPELTVNGSFPVGGEQHSPAVAVSPDGRVFVVWVHEQGGPRRVRGQFLTPDSGSAAAAGARRAGRWPGARLGKGGGS